MKELDTKTKRQINLWLWATLVMVLCMVLIGGITRLTDSGLSMVEWRPLLGAIPPLNEQEWLEVFHKYQQFPEYQIVNQRMSLQEFKFIFFWEYFHRLFGRLIGLVFILPYFYFIVKRKLTKTWNRRLLLALALGGSQGLLGWFMVKSGLVDRPDVSHFRLAAHFTLALLIMGYLYWLIMDLKESRNICQDEELKVLSKAKLLLGGFAFVLVPQLFYGAFVAGLKAGIGYNTFPKMGKHWIPNVLTSGESFFAMALESNVGVQFIHRCLGWILFSFAAYFLYFALKKLPAGKLRKDFLLISVMVFVQFGLGVATLLARVPLTLASAHQMGACFLTLFTIKAFFYVTHVNKIEEVFMESANKTTA